MAGGMSFGPTSVLERGPLALKLAVVMTSWSHLEALLAAFLGLVSSTDPDEALSLVQKFNSGYARSERLREDARASMDAALFDHVDALLTESRVIAKRRNDLVHSVWGVSDDHPGALVKTHWTGVAAPFLDILLAARQGTLPNLEDFRRPEIEVVRAAELDRLIDQIGDLTKRVSLLLVMHNAVAIGGGAPLDNTK